MKVSISASAFADLQSIKQHYLSEGVPDTGDRFVSAIIEHIETLQQHPDIGRCVPEFDTESIRELIHPPFRIVYLREQLMVHVIRVWRSERLLILPTI